MNILHEILLNKKADVALSKHLDPISVLEKSKYFDRACISLAEMINANSYPSIIAEFKRRSPANPNLKLNTDPNRIVSKYKEGGATAISILTDKDYFGGSNIDIVAIRDSCQLPILRKEFIIDEYQIIESKSIGADIILLIAEILTAKECLSLASFARSIGLEVILEMHGLDQLNKLNPHIDMIGINNRNLVSFETSIANSISIYEHLPKEIIKISESGITSSDDISNLFAMGYKGFLIGEHLMKANDPEIELGNLLNTSSKEVNGVRF